VPIPETINRASTPQTPHSLRPPALPLPWQAALRPALSSPVTQTPRKAPHRAPPLRVSWWAGAAQHSASHRHASPQLRSAPLAVNPFPWCWWQRRGGRGEGKAQTSPFPRRIFKLLHDRSSFFALFRENQARGRSCSRDLQAGLTPRTHPASPTRRPTCQSCSAIAALRRLNLRASDSVPGNSLPSWQPLLLG